MIRRIETIKYSVPSPLDKRSLAQAGCNSPNAFYNQNSHSFNICPQILNLPDEALEQVIAHEMGHSIDPCTMADPLFELKGAQASPPGRSSPEVFTLPSQPAGVYAAYDKETLLERSGGAFKNSDILYAAEGLGFSQNPLASVVSCLASPASVGARLADLGKAQKNLEKQIAALRAHGATDKNPQLQSLQGTLSRLKSRYEDRKACSDLPGRSEMQEAFADWVGAEVIGSRVQETQDPEKKKSISFEAAGFFMSMDCGTTNPDVGVADRALLKAGKCDESLFEKDISILQQGEQTDEHPDSARRVNRILLAHPAIQKALGCAPSQAGGYCG